MFPPPYNLDRAVCDASLSGEAVQGSTEEIAAGYNPAREASHGQHCQWGMRGEHAVVHLGSEDSQGCTYVLEK